MDIEDEQGLGFRKWRQARVTPELRSLVALVEAGAGGAKVDAIGAYRSPQDCRLEVGKCQIEIICVC